MMPEMPCCEVLAQALGPFEGWNGNDIGGKESSFLLMFQVLDILSLRCFRSE